MCNFRRNASEELMDEEYTKLIMNLKIIYDYVIKEKSENILWVEDVEIKEYK